MRRNMQMCKFENMQIKKFNKLSFKQQDKIYKEFWISKLGGYPDKIEKVVRIVSFEEDNRASEQIDKEYKIFIEKYKDDKIFKGEIR